MRTPRVYFHTLPMLLAVLSCGQAQQQPAELPTDRNAIMFSQRAEGALFAALRKETPLAEAYFQRFEPSVIQGFVPTADFYALGRFSWVAEPGVENLSTPDSKTKDQQLVLDGIARIMVPDWRLLTPDRYAFQFQGVTFLGTLRCLLYDVTPLHPAEDGFRGRIYLEDKEWNIVRFTGIINRVDTDFAGLRNRSSAFRVDTWRMNIGTDTWVPAYSYLEQVAPLGTNGVPLMKGQIRFWGYDKNMNRDPAETVDIELTPSPRAVDENAGREPSPGQSNRDFEKQAEQNVLHRLKQGNFLGSTGEVEKMLNQILANIEVPNNLSLAAPVHCRILLTTPFEVFTVGNSIIISRGLVDVTPTESGLAFILAHQLAHNILGHAKVDSRYAFSDVLRVPDSEILAKLRFQHSQDEETAADTLAMKLLEHSLYKPQLKEAALFLQALQESAPRLTNLIQPHFGEHVADAEKTVANHPRTRTTDLLDHQRVDQNAALPLGSRLIVNPRNGRVEYLAAPKLTALAPREVNELGISAFNPFLTYVSDESPVLSTAAVTKHHASERGLRTSGPRTRVRARHKVRSTPRVSKVGRQRPTPRAGQ
jgi:hypothetical protein